MAEIRAIGVDIDGTLLDSSGRASAATIDALTRCAEAGIVIYAVTARPRRLVFREGEVERADFLTPGGVFYNGAIAVDDRLGFYEHRPIPGAIVDEAVSVIEEASEDLQVALQFEDEAYSFRLPVRDEDLLGWGIGRAELIPFDRARERDCSKIVAFAAGTAAQKAHAAIEARFPGALSAFCTEGAGWAQVMSHEAEKGVALRRLLRARGIADEEVAVFGDDTPDIGMLRTFPHSFAMGNAPDRVKAVATHVTASNDEDGVLRALRDHLGIA